MAPIPTFFGFSNAKVCLVGEVVAFLAAESSVSGREVSDIFMILFPVVKKEIQAKSLSTSNSKKAMVFGKFCNHRILLLHF